MKIARMVWWFTFTFVFFLTAGAFAKSVPDESDEEGVLVGRISHVEGQLLRYVPEEKDWVVTVKDAPFGLDDALYSDAQARAEFVMPNGVWIRIGGSTQIQLITLQPEFTEVDVASGVARFYNRSSRGVIKATTPFGYIIAPAGSRFDLYVGEESLEVIALKEKVDFILNRDNTRYEVMTGSSSIIADSSQVASGEGNVDADWDDWNAERDRLWSKRVQVRGDSVKYLPPALHDDAYELEEHGRWETVYYEGRRHTMWRPVGVAPGWAPFTVGRWTTYYGDNCWVPTEPFGYVTHHYGNWVFIDSCSCWYWAPPAPVARVTVGVTPFLGISFGWYPGRVAWIHSGIDVGWVPLAPYEPYYCYRRWGPRTYVVNNVNVFNVNINNYRYVNHAVVVNQRNFYGVNDYRNVRITNINRTTIINNYRAAPVVNNTVITNYNTNRDRFNFTNVNVERKPHAMVVNRIQQNEQIAANVQRVKAADIQRQIATTRQAQPVREPLVQPPKVKDKLVNANDVQKPKNEVQFQERNLKSKPKPVQDVAAEQKRIPLGEVADDQGKRIKPGKAGTDIQPVEPASRIRPGKGTRDILPAEPGAETQTPGTEGRRIKPPRPGRGTPAGETQEPISPAEPGRRVKPGKGTRDITPAEPGAETQAPGTEGRRIKPPRPGRETPAGETQEPISPAEPGRRVKPGKGTRDIMPAEPGAETQTPGTEGRRIKPPRPGRETPAGDTQEPVSPAEPGRRVKPGKGTRDIMPAEPGTDSQLPGGEGRRVKPPRSGQDIQPGGAQQPVSPFDQGQRVKPGRPGRDVSPVDPGQVQQPGSESRKRTSPFQDQMGSDFQQQVPRRQLQDQPRKALQQQMETPQRQQPPAGAQVPGEIKKRQPQGQVQPEGEQQGPQQEQRKIRSAF